jgi:hypothetical protein
MDIRLCRPRLAMNGLGLLEELKNFRAKIVAIVKVARACNKYSMDLHTVILDMDRESKAFADYVSSAYERASQRAAAAASMSERSTMVRPPSAAAAANISDVSGDTIRGAMPAGANDRRGSMPKGVSRTESLGSGVSAGGGGKVVPSTAKTAENVDSFLDQMEQRAASTPNSMQSASRPPPREQKFDEDDYNSLVAELELPAAKRGIVISIDDDS